MKIKIVKRCYPVREPCWFLCSNGKISKEYFIFENTWNLAYDGIFRQFYHSNTIVVLKLLEALKKEKVFE